MKYYPVSDVELREQSLSNSASAVAFSLASACGVFTLDLTKDFAITADVPAAAVATWGGFRLAALMIGIFAFAFGLYLTYRRHKFLKELKGETSFD